MKLAALFRFMSLSVLVSSMSVLLHTRPAHAEDGSDAYDPFIDYNEFEVEDEEEADVNFFKNGRLVTAGFLIGDQTFTGGLGKIYGNGVAYGAYLNYFFDLRFALTFSFVTSSHTITVSGGGETATGNVTLSGFGVDVKYYFNTENISRGMAGFNPYVLGGFTAFSRTSTVDGEPEFARDSAVGFDAGAGFEVPILQKKMYLGAQVTYQIVNFPNQYTQITLNNGQINTGIYPYGDVITGLGIIGINF